MAAVGLAVLSLPSLACLEPNPNADAGDSSTSDTSAGTETTGQDTTDTGGAVCDPCEFAFESLEFDLGDTQTLSIPKPDRPHTVPFATITSYVPATNADALGYALTWVDVGDAYELEVALSGDSANSKVAGVAVVLGFSDELGAPEVLEMKVAANSCESVSLADLGDRVYLDAVERYEPGSAPLLSYTRTSGASLEYCVTGADAPEAPLTYKVVMFSLPEGAVSLEVPELQLGATLESADYADLGLDAASQLVHLIGARSFEEGSEPALGYEFVCSPEPPFGCTYELVRFKDTAGATAGGSILAIQ